VVVGAELLVSVGKIKIDRGASGVDGWIVAVVDDGSRHAAEDGLNDVEELCSRR